MSQGNILLPTTPPFPGATLVTDLNTALAALATSFAGSGTPGAGGGPGGAVAAGQWWLNTSVTPYVLMLYDGSQFVAVGTLNPNTHAFGSGRQKLLANTTYYVGTPPATVTITIAAPGVITWANHNLAANAAVIFTTTGALPTGLTQGTIYYVVGSSITTNTFSVSTAPNGSAITTTGAQSGTHTARTGSNSNDGSANNAQHAWLTAQYAVNWIASNIDAGGGAITIQLADGFYAEAISLQNYVGGGGAALAQTSAVIQGNLANSSAVIIQPSGANCFTGIDTYTGWTISHLKMVCPGFTAIRADYMSNIYVDGCVFGACNLGAQATYSGSFIEFINNGSTIAGNMAAFVSLADGANSAIQPGLAMTISGNPSITQLFQVGGNSTVDLTNATWSGSFTGSNFTISPGGLVVHSSGDPNSVLTGSSVGTVSSIFPVTAGTTFNNTVQSLRVTLGMSGRTTHGDANVTLTASDLPFTELTAGLTAARTWTLPLANSVPPGAILAFSDGGGINGANTLTFTRQGSDGLIGVGVAANSITLSNQFGSASFRSDGSSTWFLVAKL